MTYELRKTDENVLIAEGASVTGDVRLAKGVSIWYGAVLRGDMGPITVGSGHQYSGRGHPPRGDGGGQGLHHRPRAIVHGCTVGDNTLIGMGPLSSTARRSAATVSWVPGPWSPEKWTPRTGP